MNSARDPGFIDRLKPLVRGEVRVADSLARYSTYRIGGPATVLLPAVPEDVAAAVAHATADQVPWFAIGLGSNLLLPDEGMDALVIRLGKGLDRCDPGPEGVWRLGAGLPQPLAARRSAETGYSGLHRFVGVPGTVGGGVYMNAGCHGGDWAGIVRAVTLVDGAGRDQVLRREDIPYGYRSSGLAGRLVLEVEVQLEAADPTVIRAEVAELFRWREETTPFSQPCCGSVFTNPGGPSWKRSDGPRTAGQLIEAAGLKGVRRGGVEISQRHANYFVNLGGGTAADVGALIALARAAVRERFGVHLETEVRIVQPDGNFVPASGG